MMSSIVLDADMVSRTLSEIEKMIDNSRSELNDICNKYKKQNSYQELKNSKDLMRLYGECADDYSRICFLYSGVGEAIMDMRDVRKAIVSEGNGIVPSLVKSYKYRIDSMIEQLNIFKDSIQSSKLGLEARVRYFNSCTYTSYDRVIGAKC